MQLQEFYAKITGWLLPLGYTEIFSNHSVLPIREFHFTKAGIRVICVNDNFDPYFYVYTDVPRTQPHIAISTCRYAICSDQLDQLFDYVQANSILLSNNQS